MKVLVDTSVWSLALRRSSSGNEAWTRELAELIQEQRVVMIGPVRQELLSGIREPAQIHSLQEHLRAFPDLALTTEDYEQAAGFFNLCRGKGVQGSNTDFLICAVAARHNLAILTTDQDVTNFSEHLPIRLLVPRATE